MKDAWEHSPGALLWVSASPVVGREGRVLGSGVTRRVLLCEWGNYAVAAICLLVVLVAGLVLVSSTVGEGGLSRAMDSWDR